MGEALKARRAQRMEKDMARWRRREARIAGWLADGRSLAEIGRRLGVSRQRVFQIAERVKGGDAT